jgi:hypothetical protein
LRIVRACSLRMRRRSAFASSVQVNIFFIHLPKIGFGKTEIFQQLLVRKR